MTPTVFITGNSSGLGYGLTEEYLSRGYHVYGLSHRGCTGIDHKALHDVHCDLSRGATIVPALESLLGKIGHLDLVFLNAGVLGEVRNISETPLADILPVMDINVWANKIILDWLHASKLGIDQIISISSGAAVRGHKGWGAYSLSKATLNMLNQLYAPEYPNTHLCALAPGLVDTAMQDHLCNPDEIDADQYPSVKKLRDARGTDRMPTPRAAAQRLAQVIPRLKDYPSGSFVDVRTMRSAS